MKKIKKPTKKETLAAIKHTLFVIAGVFIMSLGFEMFLLPAQLDTGGVTGIAILFLYRNPDVDTELLVSIINVSLFFVGLIFLGWRFSLETLVATITTPISLYISKFLIEKFDFLLIANSSTLIGHEGLMIFLSAIFGGFVIGAGRSLAFLGGGSTGGVEIISFILTKYFKRLKTSIPMFIIDAIIIFLGFIINPEHDMALAIEGVFSTFIMSLVIDKLFVGASQNFIAYIITDKGEEVTRAIIEKLNRTTSIFEITGGYSNTPKKAIMVSFSVRQYRMLRTLIYSVDKEAFMTISRAHEIAGKGFVPLDSK